MGHTQKTMKTGTLIIMAVMIAAAAIARPSDISPEDTTIPEETAVQTETELLIGDHAVLHAGLKAGRGKGRRKELQETTQGMRNILADHDARMKSGLEPKYDKAEIQSLRDALARIPKPASAGEKGASARRL